MATSIAFLAAAAPNEAPRDNVEVKALVDADQAERVAPTIDWQATSQRDKARRERVMRIYHDGELHTGNDFFNAALVLQHGRTAEDFLLAHELAVLALAKGHDRAAWLAAAAEDRFLINIGRSQRFGTQYVGQPSKLYAVDEGAASVTDQLRREMHAPSLADACARERRFSEDAMPPAERAAVLEEQLRTSPADVATMMRLAEAYRECGRPDDVRAMYQRVIAIDPTKAAAYYNLACLEATERRIEAALNALAEAVRHGFADTALAMSDADLAPIRTTARFAELLGGLRRNAAGATHQ